MAYRLAKTAVSNITTKRTLGSQWGRISSYFQPSESEYTKQPVYPKILDLSKPAVQARKIEAIAEKITNLPTVEEKLVELNAPKYYGWWACQLKEKIVMYNQLPFTQFATRTCLVNGLPTIYSEFDSAADQVLPKLKTVLCDLILHEFEYTKTRTNKFGEIKSAAVEEDRLAKIFVPQLNRLFTGILETECQHLSSVEVDIEPRLEAFWSLGGIEPDKTLKKIRENNKHFTIDPNEPIDRPMQYFGNPCLTLRHKNPLPKLIDRDSGLSVEGSIPEWHLDPRSIGLKFKHCTASNTPGFWPGTELQHGYLAMLNRGHMKFRDNVLKNLDHQEGLDSQAILHSFAWALAQACYLGFGPYTELTYPITTQTIITNGQYFSFYAYQMNTCALYFKHSGDTNPHRNVCFGTEEMKLFEAVENGQVKGFNDDVLKTLIKFYMLKPITPDYDMRPYLSPERYIANVSDSSKREDIEKTFKHLLSHRPRHLLKEEVYHWEKIYKIDHDTRPVERKVRFFETGDPAPGLRRLDDHAPPYIPRVLRGKKSRRGRLPVQPTIKL